MINEREMPQKCDACNRTMTWNLGNTCKECRRRKISENIKVENIEIMNNVNVEIEESRVRERRSVRKQRRGEIKVKGGVTAMKDKGITRLFSVNWNGFGPESYDKINQLIRESERRNVDGIMISSSDTR